MTGDVKSQKAAWNYYDAFIEAGVLFKVEPSTIAEYFRRFAQLDSASPKDLADSYLTAFAVAEGARFVTFDKAFAGRLKGAVLL